MSTAAQLPAPFPSSNALNIEQLDHCNPHRQKSATSPLSAEHITYVPGEPTIKLVTAEVDAYLSNELDTVLLDEVYDHLWLVAGKSGRSIDALHAQKIKGRSIIATEDPRLHLTWHRNKFYVKPVPMCLLNHEFWTIYLSSSARMDVYPTGSQKTCQSVASSFDRSIAVGFLRSYAFLVQHRLDFILAKELHLVPDDVDWIKWSIFISNFRDLKDDQVAKRYHYGQLRLSRLNWTVRLFGAGHSRTTSFYGLPYWTTTEYMTELTFGLLFFFGGVSLVLSSMRVALAVPTEDLWSQQLDGPGLREMRRAFWVFSIAVLLLATVTWVLLLGIPIVVLAWQLAWGFQKSRKRRAGLISNMGNLQ